MSKIAIIGTNEFGLETYHIPLAQLNSSSVQTVKLTLLTSGSDPLQQVS